MKLKTLASSLLSTTLFVGSVGLVGCGSNSSEENPETELEESDNIKAKLDITLLANPAVLTHLEFALFEFEAEGATRYECQLDNDGFETCTSPLFIASINIGEHDFKVQAIAEDGTVGEPALFQWQIEDVLLTEHADLVPTNVAPSLVESNSWRGIFRINCDFSHSSYNDPIVFPGQENEAHLHRFYGNTLVDHTTTLQSLYTTGESSCQGNLLNLSSYWVPALLAPDFDPFTGDRNLDENGEPAWKVVPAVVGNDDVAHEIFYYSAGVDDLQSIQPIPAGLRMIAGDHMGQPGSEQSTSIVRWHCQTWESDDASNPVFSASIPECLAPDRVRMDIFFPSCWNGTDLDSADHKSHMAYPINDGGPNGTHCPDSHPVPIVRPSYHYAFGVTPDVYHPETNASTGWRLAADMYTVTSETPGGMSLHADWFNAWHPSIMRAILTNCVQGGLDCHDGNLANGYRLSGTQAGSQEEPAIINRGLGN